MSGLTPLRKLVALTVLVVGARIVFPYPLEFADQGRPAQYVLDCVANGNWLAPRDTTLVPATKPPLYTWLAALASLVAGRVSDMTVRVPSILSALGLVVVTYLLGRRLMGAAEAALAAATLVTTIYFSKMVTLVRTDGLLTFLLALQLLLYARRPRGERVPRSLVAWLSILSALSWMTKGPIGFLASVVIGVHVAITGERKRIVPLALVPLAAGAVALGGWFAAAALAAGPAVYDTMVSGELARHLTSEWPRPYYYLLAMPGRLGPWLLALPLLAVVSWRDLCDGRRVGAVPEALGLPLIWLVVQLAVISSLAHVRPDLAYPAVPAVCLLLGRLLALRGHRRYSYAIAALLLVGAGLVPTLVRRRFMPPDAPWAIVAVAFVLVVAAAALCLAAGRRRTLDEVWFGLLLVGVAVFLIRVVGPSAAGDRYSSDVFAEAARNEARTRGARVVTVNLPAGATPFKLGVARPASGLEDLARLAGPVLLVAREEEVEAVESAVGPCERLSTQGTRSSAEEWQSELPRLVLLAPRTGADLPPRP